MKILIPIIGFGAAGGYRVLSELANHWAAAGHHVDFLVDARLAAPYFPTIASILKFDRRGLLQDSDKPSSGALAPSGNAFSIYQGMWRALKSLCNSHDVIFANHALTTYPVALMGCTRSRKFYYVQAYEPEYYALEPGLKSRILEIFSRRSYSLGLQQIANAPIYVGHREIKAHTWIPPGIDPDTFCRRSDIPDLRRGEKLTIGIIGRREPAKGTAYALEAFTRLAVEDTQISLKVAFGNLPPQWKHDRAEVIVPQGDAQLADFYRSVDVLVAPGIVQLGACHYPVLEAMACGTPVITTDYLPATDETSWRVPIKNSAAIAEAILKVRDTPHDELRRKLDIAWQSTFPFHWARIADKFIAQFEVM